MLAFGHHLLPVALALPCVPSTQAASRQPGPSAGSPTHGTSHPEPNAAQPGVPAVGMRAAPPSLNSDTEQPARSSSPSGLTCSQAICHPHGAQPARHPGHWEHQPRALALAASLGHAARAAAATCGGGAPGTAPLGCGCLQAGQQRWAGLMARGVQQIAIRPHRGRGWVQSPPGRWQALQASYAKAAAPASTAALAQAPHLVRPALGGPVWGRGGLRRAPLGRPGGGSSGSCWSRCCALPLLLDLLLLLLLGRLHLRRAPHFSGPSKARAFAQAPGQGEHAAGAWSACWAPITQDLRAVAACMHHAWQPAPSRLPAIRACPPALPCALLTHSHPHHARLVSHPPSRSRRRPPAQGQRQQRRPQLPCG
jgi:hypothetical protein